MYVDILVEDFYKNAYGVKHTLNEPTRIGKTRKPCIDNILVSVHLHDKLLNTVVLALVIRIT